MCAAAEDCERPVTTIELAHRHQVQTRHQQTNPCRHVKRINRRVWIQRHSSQFCNQTKQQRIVEEDQPTCSVSLNWWPDCQNPRDSYRQCDDKPGEWTSQTNVKQRPA